MKKYGIIYCATNLVNGKKYVGQTTKSIDCRINGHLKTDGCKHIHRAIEKYGADWFVWRVIDTAESMDDLNKKEIYWIKELNTLAPNGYNLTTGGLNCIHYSPFGSPTPKYLKSLYMDADLINALEAGAKEKGVSFNAYVNDLLKNGKDILSPRDIINREINTIEELYKNAHFVNNDEETKRELSGFLKEIRDNVDKI